MAKTTTKNTASTDPQITADTEIVDAQIAAADRMEAADKAERQSEIEKAEQATQKAADENRLPETMAIANPAPATEMDSASGAFIEPEIKAAIPVDHPAIENNPREGTSAVQNGGDFNDPRGRHPSDPNFAGQGLDLSVYGVAETAQSKK